MSKLKILFLGDKAGYHAKIAKEFNIQGHESKLVLFSESTINFLKKSGNLDGVPYIFAPHEKIKNSKTLFRYIKNYKPDIIHSYISFSLLRTSFRLKIPWFIQFFGSDLRRKTVPLKTRLLLNLWKFRKNCLFSITTPDLLQFVPNAFFIPHPIDVDFWKPTDVLVEDRTIFFPHRFDDTKGVDFIFDAWKELRKEDIHLKLIDWGDRINEFKEIYGDRNVSYLPFISKEEMRDEINKSHIIWGQFLPNYSPQSDQEALACCKNVIGAHMDPFPIDYDPPTIKCKTPEDLKRNTLNSLNLPKNQTSNRDWVIKVHSSKNVILRILDYYKEKVLVAAI